MWVEKVARAEREVGCGEEEGDGDNERERGKGRFPNGGVIMRVRRRRW